MRPSMASVLDLEHHGSTLPADASGRPAFFRFRATENLLLLLDVDLLADSVQPSTAHRASPQDTASTWELPGPASFVSSGD